MLLASALSSSRLVRLVAALAASASGTLRASFSSNSAASNRSMSKTSLELGSSFHTGGGTAASSSVGGRFGVIRRGSGVHAGEVWLLSQPGCGPVRKQRSGSLRARARAHRRDCNSPAQLHPLCTTAGVVVEVSVAVVDSSSVFVGVVGVTVGVFVVVVLVEVDSESVSVGVVGVTVRVFVVVEGCRGFLLCESAWVLETSTYSPVTESRRMYGT